MDIIGILPLIRALLTQPPTKEFIEQTLGISLHLAEENECTRFFEGICKDAWFGEVDFREHKRAPRPSLFLMTASGQDMADDILSLEAALGAQARLDVNPHVLPHGSYSHEFYHLGVRIVFSYDTETEYLRLVAMHWGKMNSHA